MATAAQIAARKTFADLARSGAFAKKRKPAAKKTAAKKRAANPSKPPVGSMRIGTRIARLVEEGYPFKQAEAIAISEEGIKPRADKLRGALKHARTLLNYPDPLRVTKKGVVRRNPVAVKRAKNPSMPAHKPVSMFCVYRVKADSSQGALLGKFPTKPAASEYAKAYADAHKCTVGIVGKS